DGNMLRAGDVLRLETGGGGGHGHPFDRPAQRVADDVADGFVSAEAARDLYGVVLRDGEVDEAATRARRAARPHTGRLHRGRQLGRECCPGLANLYAGFEPARAVPPRRSAAVDERVPAGGAVLAALGEASVRAAAAALRRMHVEAVAVCLLHSFAHPEHERRV